MSYSLAAVAFVALTLGAAPAFAQTIGPRRDSAQRVDTVTVVGDRKPTSIFEVPLATTILGRDQIRDRRGVSLDEVLRNVPGVLALSRAGGTDVRINIRGFGARGAGDRSNAGTTRGIRVLLDGIPETEPDGRTALDLIDLSAAEGIEVTRSNASALWGNAAGGVVSVSTLQRGANREISVQSMAGSFGLRRQVARVVLPLGAGRLALTGTQTNFDGWRAHSSGERSLLNLALLAPVGTRTELGVFAVGARNSYDVPGPLTLAQLSADPRQANATYASRFERRNNRLGRLGVTVEHALDEANGFSAMLFISPKWLQRSERNTFRDFTRYHTGGNLLYRNDATFGGVRAHLLAGIDEAYQDGAVLFYSLTPAGTRGTTLRDNKREGANNFGVFVQEELLLGERLGITIGARRDAIGYNYQSFITPGLDDRRTFSRITPRLGASWRLSPTHSVYVNAGGGIEVPAGNETDPAGTFGDDTVTALNPLLEPIRSATYELGTKHLLGDGTGLVHGVMYDAALYTTDVTNEIVPYSGGRFYFTAGRVRRSGAELGLSVQLSRGFFAQTALAASRNVYRHYVVDSVHYKRPGAFADLSGNRVVGLPARTYSATAGWSTDRLAGLRVEAGTRGQSDYFADDANRVNVPSFSTLNARLSLARGIPLGERVALRGFVSVDNLADRRYIESSFLNPDYVSGVPVAFEPGLPRNVVISASLGWR